MLVSSTPGVHLNHSVCQADMSVVYTAHALEEFDVFASLRDGGLLLVNCPVNYLGAHRYRLPPSFHCPFTAVSVSFAPPFTAVRLPCRSIPADAIERGLRVFFVCGDEAARICRVDAALAVSVCVMYLAEQENGSSTKQALQVAPRAPHDLHTPCTPRPAAAILRRIVACRGALILRTTPHQPSPDNPPIGQKPSVKIPPG